MSLKLKPFFIGDLKIEFPVVLASMAGYTDLAYREICRDLECDYCTTEMMLDKCLLVSGELRRRLAAISERDHPVAGQLIGNSPDVMAAAAGELVKMGFDVIDLNFACPVNKALRRKRGGYFMSQPDEAIEVTRAVIAAVDKPVTLKLRRRFKQDDSEDNFYAIAQGAFDAGAAAIAVHGRSVEAKYTGPADWDFLADVRRRFPDNTVLGSGDVMTPQAALDMLQQTKLDGVLAARGALGNPWFFRQARDIAAGREPYKPSFCEQREIMLRHFTEACKLYGQVRGPKIMRKFGIKYARNHAHARSVRVAFIDVKRSDQWHEVVERFYTD